MQNGLLAKKFVSYRTTGYDTRKGSFARTFVRAKAPFLFAFCKKAHPLPQRNRMRVFFANKYVKID
jgi:hypothetical protein